MTHIDAATWQALCRHAQDTFPDECCGAILTRAGRAEVRRIDNIQNAMHAKDPETYPRDASTAYFMQPQTVAGRDSGRRQRHG